MSLSSIRRRLSHLGKSIILYSFLFCKNMLIDISQTPIRSCCDSRDYHFMAIYLQTLACHDVSEPTPVSFDKWESGECYRVRARAGLFRQRQEGRLRSPPEFAPIFHPPDRRATTKRAATPNRLESKIVVAFIDEYPVCHDNHARPAADGI